MKAYVVVVEDEDRVMTLLEELLESASRIEKSPAPPSRHGLLAPGTASPSEQRLNWRNIELDPVGRHVYARDGEVALTRIEFDLLQVLMRHRGRTFTRQELLDQVWGYEHDGYDKAVNGHVMNLRRKLGTACIETVRGVGYRFTAWD